MPIYQYRGQHFNLNETDPAVARAKIIQFLGAQGATPTTEPAAPEYAPEEAPAPTPTAAPKLFVPPEEQDPRDIIRRALADQEAIKRELSRLKPNDVENRKTLETELLREQQRIDYYRQKVNKAAAAAPAPAPKPAPKPAEDFEVTDPMGASFPSAIRDVAAAPAPQKRYTGSVLDTVPPEILQEKRPFTREEGLLLSQRDWAKPKPRVTEMREAPPELPKRTLSQINADLWSAGLQGGIGYFKSITDNINAGDNPASAALDVINQGLDKYSKSKQTKQDIYRRQLQIDQIQRQNGEIAAASYAARSLLSPAGADIIARGGGSILPTIGLSLLQVSAKGLAAANALAGAGEAASQSADALRKLSAEAWSNNDTYQELRAQGLNHKDAVAILSPIYALPAQATGALVGYVAGRVGLEETLGGKAVGTRARDRVVRALSELGTEELETIAPQVAANLITGAIDETTSPTTGLGQAIVETAAGALPGAALAARKGRPAAEAPAPTPPVTPPEAAPPAAAAPAPAPTPLAPSAPTAPAERVEPTFEERAPAAAPARPSVETQIEQLKANLPFLSDEEAQRIIAAREARAQARMEQEAAIEPPVLQKPEEGRLQELFFDALAKGVPAEQALVVAQNQLAVEQREAEGEARVAEPVSPPSGEGAGVAGVTAPGAPAEGARGAERAGVVPAATDVGQPAVGEGEQPVAVTAELLKDLSTETLQFLKDAFNPTEQKLVQAELDRREREPAPLSELEVKTKEFISGLSDNRLAEISSDNKSLLQPFAAEELARRQGTATTVEETPLAEAPVTEAPPTTTAEAPVVEAPKGKRGRPKLERTEEQQAKIAEQKRVTKNLAAKADYKLKQAQQQLDAATKPLDEGSFDTDEALKEAQNDQRANKRAAIREMLKLADIPEIRNTAVYKRVKKALEDPRITPQEVADIKRGLEVVRKTLSDKDTALPSVFKEGVAPINSGLSTAKNANQALAAIISKGSPFQRLVAQRLRGLVNNTRFVVLEKGDPLPDEIKPYEKDWNRANGMFVPPLNAVYVRGASFGRAQGVNNVTALHEILHAATVRKIVTGIRRFSKDAAEYKQLQKFIGDLIVTMDIAKDVYDRRLADDSIPDEVRRLAERTKGDVFTDPTEFLAYGMSDPDFQLFLMRVPGRLKDETAFSQFVRAIMRLFGIGPKDYSAFSDLVNITDKVLSERVQPSKEGAISRPLLQRDDKLAEQEGIRSADELRKKMDVVLEGLRKSKNSDLYKHMGLMQKVRDQKPVRKALTALWSKGDYKLRQLIARAPTLNFIGDWTKKDLPMIGDIYQTTQKLLGNIQELREASVSQIQMLDKDFKADKTVEDKLNDVIYTSTLMEVDPTNPRALEKEPRLTRMYEALGDNGQAVYKRVRNYHEDIRDYTEDVLDGIVRDLPGLDEDVKKNLLAQIYKQFQEDRRIEPYFPLVRDPGDYWLAVGEGDAKQIYTYETREQRAEDAERIAQEDYGGKSVEYLTSEESREMAMGNDLSSLREQLDLRGTLLSRLFQAIDNRAPSQEEASSEAEAETFAKMSDQLKNDVFNIWLAVMPEQGMRSQFRHRKGRAGYRPDIRSNIAGHMTRIAPALARLRYGPEIRSHQVRLNEAIKLREELTPFKESVDERVAALMKPEGADFWDAVAGLANKTTFYTYMTAPMTALLQPFSILISALPIISANHNANPIKVAAELTRNIAYMKQYSVFKKLPDGRIKVTAPTLLNNKSLPEEERKAIRAMISMNVTQQSHSAYLLNAARNEDEQIIKSKGREAVDLLLTSLLSNTERLTREVTYLTAYRIGRKAGLNQEEAIRQAASDTKESLGDYDRSNRPMYMQTPLGSVGFSMKMYPVVVSQQLFGNMLRMIVPLDRGTRKQAIEKFSGIIMVTAAVAGVYNMPFADLLITMLTKFLDDQDDDDLVEGLKAKDPVLWFKTVWMPQHLGQFSIGGVPLDVIIGEGALGAFTNLPIGQRIGLNDLWFRDGKPSPDLVTATQAFIFSFFPLGSYGTSVLKAYKDFMIGDYEKAFERVVPLAPARTLMGTYRVSQEGYKNVRGELVPPEKVSAADLTWQAIGIGPADVAAARETSFKLTGVVQKILIERQLLIDKLKFAASKEDYDKLDQLREEEVEEFNERNPKYRLTPQQIRDILKADREQRRKARAGIVVDKKNRELFEESVETIERRLERRDQK